MTTPTRGAATSPEPPPPPAKTTDLLAKAKSNLAFHSKWAELNGAMGDLGTYIPIVLALALSKDLDLGTTLILTGIYNVLTGAIYGVPMPVQPMKSIAAVAISSGPEFGVPEIMAAGICTSAVVLLLGATRLMGFAYGIIPLPVVRGVQLAQGLSFAMSAVKYVEKDFDLGKGKTLGDRQWLGLDGKVLALVAACFIVLVNGAGEEGDGGGRARGRRSKAWRIVTSVPSAVVVFLVGVGLAFARNWGAVKGGFRFGPSPIRAVRISRRAWKDGLLKGAVPQIPLSVLNSVIAVCKLSTDLFPEKGASATSVAVTVGVMNLVGPWVGAMPCCHGAGGLAGQYKFGGRSGGCVALLGVAKVAVGVGVGRAVVGILAGFPVGLLGVLLLFAGVELAAAARDMGSKGEAFVMVVCAAVSLVGSSAAVGFGCGVAAHLMLVGRNWMIGTRE